MRNLETTFLAFDFGLKYIGVATGQTLTQTATPLTTLKAKNGQPNWDEVQTIVNEWKPDALVIGVPLNMDGTSGEMADLARNFAQLLSEHTKLPVYECDERLSSHEAKDILLETYGPKALEKTKIDSFAAKLILESWLNKQKKRQ